VSETVTTSVETSGNSPGAVLKRCREFHEIPLEEVSQTTKIGIVYLRALEEDQISAFANLTYLKGFLRIYSDYLGLNPDDMARMYDKLYGAKERKSKVESTPAKVDRPARRLVSLQKLLLPAVILLLILITTSFFKRQSTPVLRPPQPAAIPSVTLPVSALQPIHTSAKSSMMPEKIEESRVEAKVPVTDGSDKLAQSKKSADTGKGGFILKIRVTQNGNLNAAVDGLVAQQYELTVGDIIEWKAQKSVALDLSNAGGVDVELNGKPLKQLGPTGKPAQVLLDADGIKP
jgi:cytoskeletal protein RodZ